MNFKAFKMDGLGNDFVIIDNRTDEIKLSSDQIIKICNRSFIGCDQLIIMNHSEESDADLIFYNSDGSESGACGNGTRCVAHLISEENNKKEIILRTKSGVLNSKILDKNLVETVIGIPKTEWKEIPISQKMDTKNLNLKITDNNKNEYFGGTAVNVGNPHVIFFVDKLENFNLKDIGPNLEINKLFPDRCNITLAEIKDSKKIFVKVWERGAGLTKACGSAACATAFASKINGLTGNEVDIEFELGNLSISINKNNSIKMKGAVSNIKSIEIKL
ncbi:diaminopimelate epimerase [Candidatus Pelagibacter sp.]|nr:diaminopimelate epimerase [Candidatus Pelagibacter sp.]MDA9709201.1 diaminopimelate epimerase [Candidatus Pelagibacter sp.]